MAQNNGSGNASGRHPANCCHATICIYSSPPPSRPARTRRERSERFHQARSSNKEDRIKSPPEAVSTTRRAQNDPDKIVSTTETFSEVRVPSQVNCCYTAVGTSSQPEQDEKIKGAAGPTSRACQPKRPHQSPPKAPHGSEDLRGEFKPIFRSECSTKQTAANYTEHQQPARTRRGRCIAENAAVTHKDTVFIALTD